MFWNFPTMNSLNMNACISVYTYTLIKILLKLQKLQFSKDFTMDLKGKTPEAIDENEKEWKREL